MLWEQCAGTLRIFRGTHSARGPQVSSAAIEQFQLHLLSYNELEKLFHASFGDESSVLEGKFRKKNSGLNCCRNNVVHVVAFHVLLSGPEFIENVAKMSVRNTRLGRLSVYSIGRKNLTDVSEVHTASVFRIED
jgi:hypothetical protein